MINWATKRSCQTKALDSWKVSGPSYFVRKVLKALDSWKVSGPSYFVRKVLKALDSWKVSGPSYFVRKVLKGPTGKSGIELRPAAPEADVLALPTIPKQLLFVGNVLVCLRDGSAQTSARAVTLRYKMQIQLSTSPSHSILTPGQPVPTPTLKRQAPLECQVTGMTRPGKNPHGR